MFTADTLQGMLPLARLKREFLRECAGRPSRWPQAGWFREAGGGVNDSLQEAGEVGQIAVSGRDFSFYKRLYIILFHYSKHKNIKKHVLKH